MANSEGAFYQHTECPHFPCHHDINPRDFNCHLCYCPQYLVKNCVGSPKWIGNGLKDCSNCSVNHGRNSFKTLFKDFNSWAKFK